MESADRPRDRHHDPIYGSAGVGFGRAGEAMMHLRECARLVRDTEFPDDVAVSMIRDAAGVKPAVLRSFAEEFTGRDWEGDPLLVHVSDLVSAARGGTVPTPLDEAVAEIVRMERHLLNGDPAEGFELLATRQPALRGLAQRAGDPMWRDEQDRNPPEPPNMTPGPSETPSRLAQWVFKRLLKGAERAWVDPSNDPSLEEFRRSAAETGSHLGTIAAIRRDLAPLVGPHAESEDPLIKTRIAWITASAYLIEVTGIGPPRIPPRR
jgi:hypothetical protein